MINPYQINRRTVLTTAFALAASSLCPHIVQAAENTQRIKFRELYGKRMAFTDKVKQLNGKQVIMRGFMAPPLKPDASFFVMTKIPMAVCPFCDNEADWPNDIVLVRIKQPFQAIRFNKRIEVRGTLELGTEVDQETGFVSLLRIVDAEFQTVDA